MEHANRTLICSVVFSDLVGFSKKTTTDQARLKEWFSKAIADAVDSVAVNDRILLDTGDGMVMSFMGNPEDALFVALSLRETFARPPERLGCEGVRLGIHLGPVKLVRDINGQPNLLGDGINVAQRIMSFAHPGQVVVSRQYYEVVSRLSDAYVKLFRYEGMRQDKHIREHEIYLVGRENLPATTTHPAFVVDRSHDPVLDPSAAGMNAAPPPPASVTIPDPTAVAQPPPLLPMPELAGPEPAAPGGWLRPALLATAALAAIGLGYWALRPAAPVATSDSIELRSPPVVAAAPSPSPATAPASGPAAAVPAPAKPATVLEETAADAGKPVARPPAPASPAVPMSGASAPPLVPVAPAALPKASEPAAKPLLATVELAVAPWGEIWVNGSVRGLSPPLKSLKLAPGKYTIEVRNTDFPTYREKLELAPEQKVMIQHAF